MLLKYKKLWLSLGGLIILTISLGSLMPPSSVQKDVFLIPHMDKVAHFIAYFILMAWFAQIYHTNKERLYCIVSFSLFGIILEILQGLSGIRQTDLMDALVNIGGVLLAWQLTKVRFNLFLVKFEKKWLNST